METLTRLEHVVEAQQFDRPRLESIFALAREMESVVAAGGDQRLRGRLMATLFYEPSTRTRLSFESAMLRLGGTVIGTDNAREFSSVAKGETLEDTVRIIGGYSDVIVLRHFEAGASAVAARCSPVPIINAGDGAGQHPTQALLDLYTILKESGAVDGIEIAFVGDLLNGRTVRSLCYLMTRFKGVRIRFVAPDALRMAEDIKAFLRSHGVTYTEHSDLDDVVHTASVIYQTRVQKERFADIADYEAVKGVYVIDAVTVRRMRSDAVLLHPLPRVDEISPQVDGDPRAGYFRQARNGLFIRMALLAMLLGDD
jgi:aspartate carbamoyltransferase catalytic subunit